MRWKKVESIFHEALSLHGEQRARFLEEACQGDESIRSEVDSLLANYQESDEFLEKGALISEPAGPAFNTGVLLGHYEIIQLLGRGGMGEVYLARDQRLGRKVALKILPLGVAGSIERLRREAQAASALNHPNILTIYDFGQQSELHYIVSEFVDGMHLREKIGNLSRADVLNYARQIGRALEAAHSVGIVHRDIKPENIMVRPDGYIKVLDFGLAKLLNPQSDTGKSLYERLNNSEAATVPGLLIGTINYMSPEQVRGEVADLHTDIWSWGVVLYEMFYGCRPFEAPTPQEVMAAILHKEPKLPVKNSELNRVVQKALSKRAKDRYHSMAEALGDLEQLRVDSRAFLWRLRDLGRFEWMSKKMVWISLVIAILLLGGIGGYRMYQRSPHPIPMNVTQLTKRGDVTHAVLSPDGESVVYSAEGTDGQVLRKYHLADGADTLIVKTSLGQFHGMTFSKNGKVLYYVMGTQGKGKVYRLVLDGQYPKLIVSNDIDSPISFSPDGSQFVFIRIDRNTSNASLIVSTEGDGRETPLWILKPPEYIYRSPLWSLDGRFVLFGSYGSVIKIRSVDVQGKQITGEKIFDSFLWQGYPTWVRNGRSLAVAALNNPSGNAQLFEVSWPEGVISPIYQDLLDYRDVDSLPGSQKMIAIKVIKRSTVWFGPVDQGNPAKVKDTEGKFSGIAWMPSGDLVSESDIGGTPDLLARPTILAIDPNNGEKRLLAQDKYLEKDPVVSADGRYLVYTSNSDGAFHLWRTNLDDKSAKPIRLTSGTAPEYQPVISPDSKSVIYTSVSDGFEHLWKVSIDGGQPSQLTAFPARKPDISANGLLVASEYLGKAPADWSTAILRVSDGQMVMSLPDLSTEAPARWSADGRRLFYVKTDRDGVSNIWSLSVDGVIPTQLTPFREDRIFAFALSRDRKSFACVRGSMSSDVVLLQPASAK